MSTATLSSINYDVALCPYNDSLTVEEAALRLGVSNARLLELLDAGAIISDQCGIDCVVPLESLREYDRRFKKSRAALEELTRISQELGLYDD